MSLNRVEVIGGLTRPPDLRYSASGYPMCSFTLALNDTRYDSREKQQVVTTQYVGCQAWGAMAETIAEDLQDAKGEKVYVLGQLDQSEWEDKDGKKQSKTRVKVWWFVRMEPKIATTRRPEAPEPREDDDEAPF